jgi:hypothetical protein
MVPKIGDTISFVSSAAPAAINAVVVDIKVDQRYPEYGNWIWLEYKAKGRKKKCRIPEGNLAAYQLVIVSAI